MPLKSKSIPVILILASVAVLATLSVVLFLTANKPAGAAATSQPASLASGIPDLGPGADLHGKQIFPADDPWNKDISKSPVDPLSDRIVAGIGLNKPLHPDFDVTYRGIPAGIPYIVVAGNQAKVPIEFTAYGDQSDKGPYPIPSNAPIEGSPVSGGPPQGDRHVLVVDRDNWMLYEIFSSVPVAGGKGWQADSGAIFNLKTDTLRPAGWTSSDAAGLPVFPGLVRYDEVVGRGEIKHAIRFSVAKSRRAYVPPARHWASRSDDVALPPMGMRVRLKANVDISHYPTGATVILKALKTYGMILADNGSDWFISGAPDPRWNADDIETIKKIRGKDFEVVKMDGIVTAK